MKKPGIQAANHLILILVSIVIIIGGPDCSFSKNLQDSMLPGMYTHGNENIMIRENRGILDILFNTENDPAKMFSTYSSFPLIHESENRYSLIHRTPLINDKLPVLFTLDSQGNGYSVTIGSKKYNRKFFDAEKGITFKIKPLMSEEDLKKLAFSASPPSEPGKFIKPDLVDIVKIDPTIKMNIRYATKDNFMGIRLYDQPRAFLQREAASALVRANAELSKFGYGLIVYDAYRPWYVTKIFYDATPAYQKDFVANPSKGSRHNRGGAVDVGLYDLKTGRIFDMGSGYDEFSIRAHPDYPGGTSKQRELRNKLRIIMEGEGFKVFHNEWWHFDYRLWKKYPIINLRFDEI